MEQVEIAPPKYLRGVRPIAGELLALLELDDVLCDRGRGRGVGPEDEAQLDREMTRVRREIIQARFARGFRGGRPQGRRCW
jgi:hypothetical protein